MNKKIYNYFNNDYKINKLINKMLSVNYKYKFTTNRFINKNKKNKTIYKNKCPIEWTSGTRLQTLKTGQTFLGIE
jgi:hypothetical protein